MWTILFISVALAVAIIISLARSSIITRKRSAKWDDLHERGRMFTAQLEQLRELSAAKPPQPPPETKPRALQPAKKSRSLWPRPPVPQRPEHSSANALPLRSPKVA
jgi:hypothetical protein